MRLEKLRKEKLIEDIKGESEKESVGGKITHYCPWRGEVTGNGLFTNFRFLFVGQPRPERESQK